LSVPTKHKKRLILNIYFNMDLNIKTIYKNIEEIINGPVIDLSKVEFIHPYAVILITLLLAERHKLPNKKLIFPKNQDVLYYLKRLHFCDILKELGYLEEEKYLKEFDLGEKDNLNIQEIIHSRYRDEFSARLERFVSIFKNFGLEENDARLITGIVGELGNNVFDHNALNWPTDISGCFIAAQNYPVKKILEFTIGDTGMGFSGSLKARFPNLKNDIEAILLGLAGNTGRIDEIRGNGLRIIRSWTIDNFRGNIYIHSGNGLVKIDEEGIKFEETFKIIGTIVQVMLYYK